MQRLRRHTKRLAIGIAGGFVLLIGLVAIPYPGPGWVIVFAGLAILATEFAWAKRVLDRARGHYGNWMAWLKRQHIFIRLLILGLTGVVVVVTVWLLNGYGLVDDWLHLHQAWVHSPLLK